MPSTHDLQMPLARTEGLLLSPLNDELVIYDTEHTQAHSLNRTTSLIWQHCDGQTSVKQLAEMLSQNLQTPVDEQIVLLALQQLERNRLLQTSGALPEAKISRRELARRLGLIAATVLPVVTSLAIPPAAAASSCAMPCVMNENCPLGMLCIAGCCQ